MDPCPGLPFPVRYQPHRRVQHRGNRRHDQCLSACSDFTYVYRRVPGFLCRGNKDHHFPFPAGLCLGQHQGQAADCSGQIRAQPGNREQGHVPGYFFPGAYIRGGFFASFDRGRWSSPSAGARSFSGAFVRVRFRVCHGRAFHRGYSGIESRGQRHNHCSYVYRPSGAYSLFEPSAELAEDGSLFPGRGKPDGRLDGSCHRYFIKLRIFGYEPSKE